MEQVLSQVSGIARAPSPSEVKWKGRGLSELPRILQAWELKFDANSEKSVEEQLADKLNTSFSHENGTWEPGTR